MSDQLELFVDEPFCLRLRIEEAMNIFWEHYWKDLAMAPKTRKHRERILEFFKGRYIDTISKADIEDFVKWCLALGLKRQTVNKAQTLLSRMFKILEEYRDGGMAHGIDYSRIQLPKRSPCTFVPKINELQFARRTTATPAEFKRLFLLADEDMRDNLIMLLDSGLRPGDLSKMTSKNVDLQRQVLSGIQHKDITRRNPSGYPYNLKMTKRMVDILLNRLAQTKPETPLFPMTNWQKRWKELRETAGCLHIQRRDLRRTKGRFLIDIGTDQLTTAHMLGHKDTEMIEKVYAPRTLLHQEPGLEKLEEVYQS